MLNRRLLVKTLVYKTVTFFTSLLIFAAVTGSFAYGTGLSLVLVGVNTLLYYFHEWLWQKNDWGRPE